jgi:membrane-bound inhibitor of C-type lysozyme
MQRMWLSLFTVALAFASGSAGAQTQKSFVYRCTDGTEVTATFIEMKAVRLQFPARNVVLPLQLSASGSRYADDSLTF